MNSRNNIGRIKIRGAKVHNLKNINVRRSAEPDRRHAPECQAPANHLWPLAFYTPRVPAVIWMHCPLTQDGA